MAAIFGVCRLLLQTRVVLVSHKSEDGEGSRSCLDFKVLLR